MAEKTSADTLRRIQGHISNLGSLDDPTAQEAERRLIRFGTKALEPLLIAANSDDPQVRFRVVWVLGKSRDARALSAILRLTEDADKRVAYDAVLALGELGDFRAVPRLEELSVQFEGKRGLVGASWAALKKLRQPIPEEQDAGAV